MKITDYGLWFADQGGVGFSKMPIKFSDIHINGICVGGYSAEGFFCVYILHLHDIGFIINPDSPGENLGHWWDFPLHYVPTESDFEEIS